MPSDLSLTAYDQAQTASAQGARDRLTRLAAERTGAGVTDPEEAGAIREQAMQFESMLMKMMLDSMRKNVGESDLFGNPESSERAIYRSMLDTEYAKVMAQNSRFGFSDMVMRQFGVDPDDPSLVPEVPIGRPSAAPSGAAQATPAEALPVRFSRPVAGPVSSPFGMREDPIHGQLSMHHGTDYAVPEGTPVRAAAPGRVLFSGTKPGYGETVILDHGNGITSIYGHLKSPGVKTGDLVERGSVIGQSGQTGRSTGPHLHFEIRQHEKAVNPQAVLENP